MQIRVEQYGDQIGVDGNLTKVITEKKIQLLLTITSDDNRERLEFVLNRKQAETLADKLTRSLNDPILAESGFVVV